MNLKKFHRAWIYILGMLVLALGLTLNAKTGMGVAPILSIAYTGAQIWQVNLGDATLVLYVFLVAGQFLLRGKERQWFDLLQLPLSVVFSRVLNVLTSLIPYDCVKAGLGMNLVLLVVAILVTGLGVSMSVNMCLVPNPGDGIVQALSQRMGWEQGMAKNIFDVLCVMLSAVVSFAVLGKVSSVGLGTLVAMVGVGRAIALTNRLLKQKMCAMAGLSQPMVSK